jgi:hypothetical protein
MDRYGVAVVAVALVAVVTATLMVVLNLGGHAAEPAITTLFTMSGTAFLILVGAGYVHKGGS